MRRRFRGFPHTPCPYYQLLSHIRVVDLLQWLNLHWHIVTQSPSFTLGFTLGVYHSMHLDVYIITCIHHSGITWSIFFLFFFFFKDFIYTLAGVAQWIECRSVNRKVTGLIPSQGTCLGCGPGLQLRACERQLINVSLANHCLSPSLSPSLSLKINKTCLKN